MYYKPRRCSKRWLDGDCPPEVLAILDHGDRDADGQFEVIYADVVSVRYGDSPRVELWMTMLCLTGNGSSFWTHWMQSHEVADYRYRMKHRYTRWSTLPTAVKDAVRRDLEPGRGVNGRCLTW